MTQVTVNGNTYSDDGTSAKDMLLGGFRTHLLPMISDGVTDLATKQAASEAAEDAAAASAVAADASADASLASANASAASAIDAAGIAAGIRSTSTTSIALGTGSKVFTTQAGKQFSAGAYVMIVSAADVNNYMTGQVTSYVTTTLTVDVIDSDGTGTFADWSISISGVRGTDGPLGMSSVIRETATATASQTVFDLTNFYVIGTNGLWVYINGVRQFPGTYTETDTNTVTFSTGLTAGDKVLFEIGIQTEGTTAPAVGVSFSPTASIPQTNVQDAITNLIPNQTGNAGKFVTTDGTTASWTAVPPATGSSIYMQNNFGGL